MGELFDSFSIFISYSKISTEEEGEQFMKSNCSKKISRYCIFRRNSTGNIILSLNIKNLLEIIRSCSNEEKYSA